MKRYPKLTMVEVSGSYSLHLHFADHSGGEIDLSDEIVRTPMFEKLRMPEYFAQAALDPERGTVVWPGGEDVAPETLYEMAMRHAFA